MTWTTVFDSAVSGEYVESAAGKTHSFTARSVRYVRDWLNGSTSNSGNHWVEIEVWGTANTAYIGNYFEWTGSTNTMTKYYYAGGQRVAVRRGSTLSLLFGDHLGSTANTADPITGRRWTSLRYKAWGEQRYAEGAAPTEFHFTGQRELAALGLLDYGARWYDSALGRFIQPDTIVPLESQGVQAWDRFAYANNNPVRYTDPTGYCSGDPTDPSNTDQNCWKLYYRIHKWYKNVNLFNPYIWELSELEAVSDALRLARKAVGGIANFQKVFGDFTITHGPYGSAMDTITNAIGMAPPGMNTIVLSDRAFSQSSDDMVHTILHEMGHIFDFKDMGSSIYKSQIFVDLYGSGCSSGWLGCASDGRYGPLDGKGYNADPDTTSRYGRGSSIDDFADSFAAYVLSKNSTRIPDGKAVNQDRLIIISVWVNLVVRSK